MPPRPDSPVELPEDAAEQIQGNLERCREAIAQAARRAGRDPGQVSLVAVTKYVDAAAVRVLHSLGVRDFGESTVQGVETKRESLEKALPGLEGVRWHLIGHLQRNKVARALQLCHAIHSVDSERLVREISAQAARRGLPVPELYVEVNVSGEPQKTGCSGDQLEGLLREIQGDPRLAPHLRGLMAMAPHSGDPEAARPSFRRLRELRDSLRARGILSAEGLSMGMSGDFSVAVDEGSTLVRVGSMLFEKPG